MKHGGNVWQGGGPEAWLDFSASLRPEGPPEWVRRTAREALAAIRYYPDRSLRSARQGTAAYANVPEGWVLPAAGGEAAIDLALSLRKSPVYVEKVTFGLYAERAAVHHRPLSEAMAGATVTLCNPNNPTGAARTREAVLSLHESVAATQGELLVDEAFIDYCPENSVRDCACDTLTIVGSLTKILSIPGLRLGYVIASPENIRKMETLAPTWPLNALAAAIAAELPLHKAEIARDAEANRQRRAAFAASLQAMGAQVYPSQANFLFCDFARDMTEAAERLKQRGILVRTCASFGLGGQYLRLAVKTEEENETLIRELKQCLS